MPLKASLQPQPLASGTEGQRDSPSHWQVAQASYIARWAHLSSLHRAEQGPLQASSWGLEALVRVVSPPITSSLTRKRADGREVGMEVGLDAQPDHGSPPNSLAGWREQGMGKSVRAAGGGISGRGECDGGGARKEHSALNPPTPSALP